MITRFAITILALASAAHMVMGATMSMDSARGEQLFSKLACVGCHSINGQGGKIGPDLGGRMDRGFTPASLASAMWNHAPVMWSSLRARGVVPGDVNEQAAADLFAYFYSARFFERPGDAGRGKQWFTEKHCADCHGLRQATDPVAKPVVEWQSTGSSVALVNAMWNHASTMRQEFARRKISWPELTAQDLADILLYVRNLPGSVHPAEALVLSSSENGSVLFDSKGCDACHSHSGKDALSAQLRGQTLVDVAVDMWNHAPRMAKEIPALNLDEMRELTGYLWAQQFFVDSGSQAAGKRVFTAKHCATCHDDASSGAPKLENTRQTPFTASAMVSVLWHHGAQMMEQMKSKGIPWPRFDGAQMTNLIAYLNSRGGGK